MLKKLRPFIIVIHNDKDKKEDIIHLLASEGCLVSAFTEKDEAMRYLRSSYTLPKLVLIDSKCSIDDPRFLHLKVIKLPNEIEMKQLLSDIISALV